MCSIHVYIYIYIHATVPARASSSALKSFDMRVWLEGYQDMLWFIGLGYVQNGMLGSVWIKQIRILTKLEITQLSSFYIESGPDPRDLTRRSMEIQSLGSGPRVQ